MEKTLALALVDPAVGSANCANDARCDWTGTSASSCSKGGGGRSRPWPASLGSVGAQSNAGIGPRAFLSGNLAASPQVPSRRMRTTSASAGNRAVTKDCNCGATSVHRATPVRKVRSGQSCTVRQALTPIGPLDLSAHRRLVRRPLSPRRMAGFVFDARVA
jgi:hypothetical protein